MKPAIVSKRHMEQYLNQGYFIISEPVLEKGELKKLREEAIGISDEITRQSKQKQLFIPRAHLKSNTFKALLHSVVYWNIYRELFGSEVDTHYDSLVFKHPYKDSAPVLWHQDAAYGAFKVPHSIMCWTTLTPATVRNGCLWVIPGSHKHGQILHNYFNNHRQLEASKLPEVSKAIPIEMDAGQILVIHNLLLHTSKHNTSSQARIAYAAGFMPPQKFYVMGELYPTYPISRNGIRCI